MSSLHKPTRLAIATATAMAIGATVSSADINMYKGYETPPYAVLSSHGRFEIREYAPHLLAEVSVTGSRTSAVGRGFRQLAGYIFGSNATSQKVAMTAPVAQMPADGASAPAEGGAQVWNVQFMMPRAYTRETLPRPDNAAIRFRETTAQTQVVVMFSGRWTAAQLKRQTDALRQFARQQDLSVIGEPRYYFYDDPFTLPFRRRNEVAFVVG